MNHIVFLRRFFGRVVESAKGGGICNSVCFFGFATLTPFFAPMYSAKSVAVTIVNLVAIVVGIGMMAVGAHKLLKADSIWKGLFTDVIPLIVGGGILVTGSLGVFGDNTLGEAGYNLLVQLFSS